MLKLDLTAYNYIEYIPDIEQQEMQTSESVTFDLADHFRFVTGDTVPKITGDTLRFTLLEDENPDILTSSLNGSELTLQAGNTEGSSAAKIKISAGDFTERIDYISVLVRNPEKVYVVSDDPWVKIYPNPAGDQLNIEFTSTPEVNTIVELMDISGKIIVTSTLENNITTHTINLQSCHEGLYFIRISNEKYTLTEKVIKIK